MEKVLAFKVYATNKYHIHVVWQFNWTIQALMLQIWIHYDFEYTMPIIKRKNSFPQSGFKISLEKLPFKKLKDKLWVSFCH